MKRTVNANSTQITRMAKKTRLPKFKKSFIWTCAVLGTVVAVGGTSGAVMAWSGDTDASPAVEKLPVVESIADVIAEEAYAEPFTLCTLPYNGNYGGFKSYESYTAITDKDSDQYALQTIAWTDTDAFRRVDDYYLVAVGTYFEAPVGTAIDVVLENGTVIPCLVGDIKADEHTDSSYHIWSDNNCATEFIVDALFTDAKTTGDVSSVYPAWQSRVVSIKVYENNYLS